MEFGVELVVPTFGAKGCWHCGGFLEKLPWALAHVLTETWFLCPCCDPIR